jgi:hypothetical protein
LVKEILGSVAIVVFLVLPVPARAQQPAAATAPEDDAAGRVVRFLGGAAAGLAAHEAGHWLFGVVFDAKPGLKSVHFGGLPFFAITHRSDLTPRREFTVSSAGFWVQHATSELLLSRQRELRKEQAPFKKGLLAFNVLTSVGYSAVAMARGGPYERDTRAMSEALKIDERWIGVMVLAPAVLDTYRYFHPKADWAVWGARVVKAGMVVMVIKK